MSSKHWLEVRIDLGDLPAEPVEWVLQALGAISVEYRDAGNQAIFEPEPGATPLWCDLRLIALFEFGAAAAGISRALVNVLSPAECPAVRFNVVEGRDWVRAWQQEVGPMEFGRRLRVYPSHHPRPPETASISMDPGLAFGTGTHCTTALCLEWLARQDLKNRSLLDYGCGSGILAIAGLALGAADARAVDNDPQALTATRNNAAANHYQQRIRVSDPGDLEPGERFEFIVANILSGTLIALAPELRRHALPGTRLALGGILRNQAAEIYQAYGDWLDFGTAVEREGWVLLTAKATE